MDSGYAKAVILTWLTEYRFKIDKPYFKRKMTAYQKLYFIVTGKYRIFTNFDAI